MQYKKPIDNVPMSFPVLSRANKITYLYYKYQASVSLLKPEWQVAATRLFTCVTAAINVCQVFAPCIHTASSDVISCALCTHAGTCNSVSVSVRSSAVCAWCPSCKYGINWQSVVVVVVVMAHQWLYRAFGVTTKTSRRKWPLDRIKTPRIASLLGTYTVKLV